jgi:hypothetical protein
VTHDEIRALYERRHAVATADTAAEERLSDRVSNLRGLAFAAVAGAGISLLLGKYVETAAIVLGVGVVAFAVLIVWHGRVLARESEARRRALVNGDALLRVTGRSRELAQDGKRFQGLEHPYADDLDLFGPNSLYQRISVAHTRFGEDALARYLREPAGPAEIARRQTAVRALAPELDLRQRFEAFSFGVVKDERQPGTARKSVPDPEPLFQWAKRTDGASADALLTWGSRLLPPLTLAALIAWTRGASPFFFVGALVLQAYLIARGSAATGRAFLACSSTEGAFRSYGPMLSLVEGLTIDAPLLSDLKKRLGSSERPPSVAMGELERILGWFELRHNGLVYPIVNLFTLWDVHCTLALEAWRKRTAPTLEDWFAVLGEVEALSSLSGLAHDEPDFCFPEVSDELPPFEAESLGHPLIAEGSRKPNDVSLSAPGTALLVTGSNMSGKSTLLRAMGLAAVLAFAGGPVCARRLRMMPLVIRTSIRVSDSLERGVSHFYAEVKKIKAVVEAATGNSRVLFLLDEVLHGTNSRERQIGARWVITEMLARGAVGAVSTHDEELCRLTPELMSRVHLVHFRETVKDGAMTFDYTLREGPVQGGNALRVMQLAGLGVPLEGAE